MSILDVEVYGIEGGAAEGKIMFLHSFCLCLLIGELRLLMLRDINDQQLFLPVILLLVVVVALVFVLLLVVMVYTCL